MTSAERLIDKLQSTPKNKRFKKVIRLHIVFRFIKTSNTKVVQSGLIKILKKKNSSLLIISGKRF